jgi:hypothetical protein
MYAAEAVERRRGSTQAVTWRSGGPPGDVETGQWVVDQVPSTPEAGVLIGKSLGSYATWNSSLATELTPHVLTIPDADHGMFVPGRLAASAAVLGQVTTAVEDFLDDVVWP